MKHRTPLRFARPVACSLVLCLLALIATETSALSSRAPAAGAEAVTEGVADFEINYDDMGPMGAMLPKTERIYFRPDQVRIESGTNVTLRGVVPGRLVQMMDLGGHKVAFLIAAEVGSGGEQDENELLRFEAGEGTRTIAGLTAREVEGVDREDDTNRISYWLTDQVAADFQADAGMPDGFPLDYVQILGEGTAHKVATQVEGKALESSLFTIPDDYQQIEVASASDIPSHLSKILGGDVQVIEQR